MVLIVRLCLYKVVARAPITLLTQTRTDFNNKVIVKQFLILEGIIAIDILFLCGIFLYLCMKMRSGHIEIAEKTRRKSEKLIRRMSNNK